MYLVLANGHRADAVLLPQFLGQPGRQGLSEHVGGGIEMVFEVYAAVRGHQGMELPGGRLQSGSWRNHYYSPVPVPVACMQARK